LSKWTASSLAEPRLAPGARSPRLAPRVALTITVTVLCGFTLVAISYLLSAPHTTADLLAALLSLAVLLVLQAGHSLPAELPLLSRRPRWTLAAQVVVTYVPFAFAGAAWMGMPGFLAGSCLLVLPARFGWAAFLAVLASTEVIQFIVGFNHSDVMYNGVSTIMTGLVVYGISTLSSLVRELEATRHELAQFAVTRERLRFARDLHDLLGYSLSAVTLKCELISRLMRIQPEHAAEEMAEVLRITRQALMDVRTVASNYRQMNLHTELRSAESMLKSLGIRTDLRLSPVPLSKAAETMLATVVREGITNMLRHSCASWCRIELCEEDELVRMTLTNDGTQTSMSLLPNLGEGGNGLGNLGARARDLGGAVSARTTSDGAFELTALLPRSEPTGVAGDPHGIDPIAGVEFGDRRGQVVADGAGR